MADNKHWTDKDIPDQRGKTILITGANSGIGFEAAKALAAKHATVILACRSLEKGEKAVQLIRSETPDAHLKVMALDLADMSSVRSFARLVLEENDRLDVLVNNAGVMATPHRKTADGFELQFGTNHLGHFLLTGLLIDLLKATPSSRVVTVSSYAHIFGFINFGDLQSERFYQKWLAYCQSKLANLLFARELQRRLTWDGGNPLSIAVHPGYAATNLQQTSWFYRLLNPYMAQSQQMGALPTLYAATSADIHGGEYIGPDGFLAQHGYPHLARSGKRAHNKKTARRLWQVSEELVGLKYLDSRE